MVAPKNADASLRRSSSTMMRSRVFDTEWMRWMNSRTASACWRCSRLSPNGRSSPAVDVTVVRQSAVSSSFHRRASSSCKRRQRLGAHQPLIASAMEKPDCPAGHLKSALSSVGKPHPLLVISFFWQLILNRRSRARTFALIVALALTGFALSSAGQTGQGPSRYLFTWVGDEGREDSDFLAVVDLHASRRPLRNDRRHRARW